MAGARAGTNLLSELSRHFRFSHPTTCGASYFDAFKYAKEKRREAALPTTDVGH
jgi:hypothetical protein